LNRKQAFTMSNYNWRQYGPPNVNNAQANGNGFFHTSRTNNNTYICHIKKDKQTTCT